MLGISYWIFPLFAGLTWFGTLLAMMLVWVTEGEKHLRGESANEHIPYISDIGASGVKPLFIAGSTVTVVVFDVVFIAERWLRHRGRLAHNTSRVQKGLSICATFFALLGALGLILLTIFDTVHHHHAHDALTVVFIAGYIISAIFVCAEYQRLGIHYRQHRILRISFWIKLFFIIVEIALAIAFGVCGDKSSYNAAAVLEWTIALFFILYVLSYVIDFLPAVHSKHNLFPAIEAEMGEGDVNGPSNSGGPVYAETYSNTSYGSNEPMQQITGGRHYPPYNTQAPLTVETNVPASRNF
ncbi:Frag1/DRAM/Sfk1 family-domain-containing protein [Delphinella strobiligena]|nr:Frag1/DRAM/Sfk1 family-domain-containing protein [Delphinella strobiligena]